jgi:hypothetical protein
MDVPATVSRFKENCKEILCSPECAMQKPVVRKLNGQRYLLHWQALKREQPAHRIFADTIRLAPG